jgi:hypothetical protein
MPHRHYSYYWHRCRECGQPAADYEYCEECRDRIDREAAEIASQIAADEAAAAAEDSVPTESICTCTMPYVPSNALYPPEPILNRYCPIHGDGGPDPDRALEERREAIRDRKADLLDNGD